MAIRLQTRDRQLLSHLRRYGLSTPEVLKRLLFDDREEAMKSTLKRLRRAELIASEKLYARGNEVYVHLTPTGAVAAGLSEKSGHAVADTDLPRVLGALLFCCAGEAKRVRFTAEEFDACFPGIRSSALERRFPYDSYFLDVDREVRRLGRILVESGGTEIIFRAKKCLHEDGEVLERFVSEGRYALGLVVASASKVKQVERQLAAAPLLGARGERVRVLVEAHPALQGTLLDGGAR